MYTVHISARPLRTTAFEARYAPGHLPWSVLLTNFPTVEGRSQTTPWGCGRVPQSNGKALAGKCHPSRNLTADLRNNKNWSLLLLSARTSQPSSSQPLCQNGGTHKNSDIVRVCGYFCLKRTRKRICLPIPKPTEQGIQSEDTEKRRQGSILSDRPLDRKSLWTFHVHLHPCLRVMVHHTNPFAELQFESGG